MSMIMERLQKEEKKRINRARNRRIFRNIAKAGIIIGFFALFGVFLGCATTPPQRYILDSRTTERFVMSNSTIEEKRIEGALDVSGIPIDERYKVLLVVNETDKFCKVLIGSLDLGKYDYFLAPRKGFTLMAQAREQKFLWVKYRDESSLGRARIWWFCWNQPDFKRDFVGEGWQDIDINGFRNSSFEGQDYGAVVRIGWINRTSRYPFEPTRLLADFGLWFVDPRDLK